ncbi:MAG: type IV pilus assembly protein PilM [Kiritimatiellae bacterium]|nr:type IV pilus assembly protein PilM [Kiritimatiellia bacterium]
MFSSDRILALNIGASKILLAEFVVKSGRSPELVNYGFSDVASDPENDVGVGAYLADSVRQIMKSRGIRPAPLMLCLSGQKVFPRFVRLPAVSSDKLIQMVQYEVEQNVPFPLDEIVWNYQFIGDASSGEQSAMIVAAKIEDVREVTTSVTDMNLEPEVVDVAPMALYNCLRYNDTDLDGCTILLDIGARSTNLVFIEDEKIYSRCIQVAGNAITQELAKGFGISFAEAEEKKRAGAFVSLGGVYAAEDPDADRMSKIVRNVVTRLHAEISRSINFYRSQQGGSAPKRLILTGGSSVIPQLDTFFQEKLHVEVRHLNPFVNVAVGSKLNAEQLSSDAFVLAEAVGLALRRSLACPIEINLMPPEIIKQKSFRKRIPYFGISVAGILLSLGVWTMYERQMVEIYSGQRDQISTRLNKLKQEQSKLDKVDRTRKDLLGKADAEAALMRERTVWLKRLDAIQKSLFEGMWLTDLTPMQPASGGTESPGIIMKGCGWKDKMKTDGKKTAIEALREKLKQQPVFSNGKVDIKEQKEVGAYVIEFTLEATYEGGADQDAGSNRAKR